LIDAGLVKIKGIEFYNEIISFINPICITYFDTLLPAFSFLVRSGKHVFDTNVSAYPLNKTLLMQQKIFLNIIQIKIKINNRGNTEKIIFLRWY